VSLGVGGGGGEADGEGSPVQGAGRQGRGQDQVRGAHPAGEGTRARGKRGERAVGSHGMVRVQFDKALELAVKYDFLPTEKAYCLYRLKKVRGIERDVTTRRLDTNDAFLPGR